MSVVVAAAVIAAVVCLPRRRAPRERVVDLTAKPLAEPRSVPSLRRPVVLVAALAIAAVVITGESLWWALLLVVAGLVGARARTPATAAPEEVALAADLMAACMAAGAGTAAALGAATAATDGLLQTRADAVIEELRRGSPPEQAWASWLDDERLAPVARSCVRSSGSGAANAAELARVAARIRARHRARVEQRVARASVWVVLPLGLCFLPAFVLVGVVPLVLGLLNTLR